MQPKQPIPSGQQFDVRIKYSGEPKGGAIPGIPAPNGWVPTDDGVITLNEPDGASRVFPSNDHPTDKASYTFRLDVPSSKTAIANGNLTSRTEDGDRTTWVWEQDAPMATLPLAARGRRPDARGPARGRRRHDPQRVRPRGAREGGEGRGAHTRRCCSTSRSGSGSSRSRRTACSRPNEAPSGLAFEAQTFSLFGPDLFYDPELASVVLAHELSHQWFGDWVSPASWDETWLNEGFATYAEWLWSDHALGIPMSTNVEDALVHAQGSPGAAASDPGRDAMFDHAVYERGALTLHALRLTVGDEKFAQIIHRYLEEYGGKTATTQDLVDIASDVAGTDLGDFFEQWLGPGEVPELPQTPAPVGSTPPTTAAPAPTA